MKRFIPLLFTLLTTFNINAQIGYQVSLLDAATGQPRADETVSVRIDITDSTGALVCSETKSATSDDFGVLSLTIGNASTFSNADWSKLPFFISATVDDVLLGKSQILNVPVAEYAKTTGKLTKKLLMSKVWRSAGEYNLKFSDNYVTYYDDESSRTYKYNISGDFVICYDMPYGTGTMFLFYTGTYLVESDDTIYT
ncbi:MAG: hypothetical protein K2H17_10525 [Duncaniella sp.]|uniref:hypothetical protein n=1 Tax=Duncaniella sp. TaxID=2518496 RepID=UPI0023D1057B|nr:hypothetical protein [Duncaniella sp.]MDE5989815.1 hypothetical protein [Duncaniella sp.]